MVGLFIFLMVGLFASILLEVKSGSGRRVANFELLNSYGDEAVNFNILSKNIKLLNEKVDAILKLQKDKELINLVAETNIKSKGLLELLNKLSYDSLSYYNALLTSLKKSNSDGEKTVAKLEETLRLLKGRDSYLEDRAAAIRSSMDRINDEDVEKSVESDKQLLENQVSRREFDEEMDEFVKDRGVRKALVGLRRNIENYDKEVPMEEIITAEKDTDVLGAEDARKLKESIDSIDNLDDFPPLEPESVVPNIAESEDIKLLKGITSVSNDVELKDVSVDNIGDTNNGSDDENEIIMMADPMSIAKEDVDDNDNLSSIGDNNADVDDEVNDALKLDSSTEADEHQSLVDFNPEEDANILASGMEAEEEAEGLNLDAVSNEEEEMSEPEIAFEDADGEEELNEDTDNNISVEEEETIEDVPTDVEGIGYDNEATMQEEEIAEENEDNYTEEEDYYQDEDAAVAEEEETYASDVNEENDEVPAKIEESEEPSVGTENYDADYGAEEETEEEKDFYSDEYEEEEGAAEEDMDKVEETVQTESAETDSIEEVENSSEADNYDDDYYDDSNDGYEEEALASSEEELDDTAEEDTIEAENKATIQKEDEEEIKREEEVAEEEVMEEETSEEEAMEDRASEDRTTGEADETNEDNNDSYDSYNDEKYEEDNMDNDTYGDGDGYNDAEEEEINNYSEDTEDVGSEGMSKSENLESNEDSAPRPATEFNIKDSINKLKERLKIGAENQ